MGLREDVLTKFRATPKSKIDKMISEYKPVGKEEERLKELARDYSRADIVRNGTYEEFGFKSLMQIVNRDRKRFNNFVPESSDNIDEDWRSNTIRPITRNKVISIAAHITSSLIYPNIFAQNEEDNEDKEAGIVMRDLNLWTIKNSDYSEKFVKGVVKALVDPAMIMYEGYSEVKRKIKELKDNGEWVEKEIIDETFSGFQNILIPVEELYISNIYESSVQKQPFIIWRKVIDYESAKIKHGNNEKFNKYVRPGIKVFYSDEKNGFYQIYDESLAGNMVEEVVYYNRLADLELRVINGVLIDDPDRPIQRKDKVYPFAKTGFEYFGGTDFFYYKSLVDKMSSDQTVIDTLYNMIIDGTFLKIMPPGIIIGDEEVDSSVIVPGGLTVLREGSAYQPINIGSDLNAGMNMLQKVESSASESSTDPLQSGMQQDGTPPTAYAVSRQEANAKTVLGLFGKMISQFVKDFGDLRVPTILQYMTVAKSMETLGDSQRLIFRNFLIPAGNGDKVKKIEFDALGFPETEDEAMEESFKLYEREIKDNMSIAKVNPDLFRRNKYMTLVEADFMPVLSESLKKALNLEAYDRLIQNPYIKPEKVTADFLIETYKPGEADKYLKSATGSMQSEAMGQIIPGGNSNVTSQILNKNQAGEIM